MAWQAALLCGLPTASCNQLKGKPHSPRDGYHISTGHVCCTTQPALSKTIDCMICRSSMQCRCVKLSCIGQSVRHTWSSLPDLDEASWVAGPFMGLCSSRLSSQSQRNPFDAVPTAIDCCDISAASVVPLTLNPSSACIPIHHTSHLKLQTFSGEANAFK